MSTSSSPRLQLQLSICLQSMHSLQTLLSSSLILSSESLNSVHAVPNQHPKYFPTILDSCSSICPFRASSAFFPSSRSHISPLILCTVSHVSPTPFSISQCHCKVSTFLIVLFNDAFYGNPFLCAVYPIDFSLSPPPFEPSPVIHSISSWLLSGFDSVNTHQAQALYQLLSASLSLEAHTTPLKTFPKYVSSRTSVPYEIINHLWTLFIFALDLVLRLLYSCSDLGKMLASRLCNHFLNQSLIV